MIIFRRIGKFILCLLLNMIMTLEWSIPAWVFLVLHFVIGLPLWVFFVSLGLWIFGIILWMKFIGFATKSSNTPDPVKENKNPYSSKNKK